MRRNLLNILLGVSIGALVAATGAYMARRWDNAIVMSDVGTAVAIDTRSHERWLAVRYHIDKVNACPSWSQHLIYRDNQVDDHIQRNYVPLAITANGIGANPEEHDFALSFRLPPDLLPGKWWYVVVTSASCEWLPGLIRPAVTETTPQAVNIK